MSNLTVPQQVTSLLYNEMTSDDIIKMTDEELIFFFGCLDHWMDRIQDRIDKLSLKPLKMEKL